jgi:hypothetical protein
MVSAWTVQTAMERLSKSSASRGRDSGHGGPRAGRIVRFLDSLRRGRRTVERQAGFQPSLIPSQISSYHFPSVLARLMAGTKTRR